MLLSYICLHADIDNNDNKYTSYRIYLNATFKNKPFPFIQSTGFKPVLFLFKPLLKKAARME